MKRPPRYNRWRGGEAAKWQRHRRWFFRRFLMGVALLVLLVSSVTALLTGLLSPYVGGGRQITALVLVSSCGLMLALPTTLMGFGWFVFRRMAMPVAQVMAVTDAVAEGDLTARVEGVTGGRFGQLSRSLNNMVAELEAVDARRRQLTADIAHELRTPLHIVQGNLEGILDGVYEPTEAHIQQTLEETQLLARLVEDLETLSLAEAGQLPLAVEPVDVGALLLDVATSFSGQAANAGIVVVTEAPPEGELTIQGDAMRLDQVLGNLVSNAIRHTPPGGTITLGAARQDGVVRLIVADSGEGIPPEDLPFVFDRFWRGDRARTHAAGTGGGLGLAIAAQLVKAHAGTIHAESALGAGTTFTIELPAERVG
jgi:signal transduction histidine kinase